MGLLQVLLALRGSAASHDCALLLLVGWQRIKHLLQALCDDGKAGSLVGLRVPAFFHKLLYGIWHRLSKPAAQLPASSALPDRAGHVRLPFPAPLHIARHPLLCVRSNVTAINQHKGQKEGIGLKTPARLHQVCHCVRVPHPFLAAVHSNEHASSISRRGHNHS